MTTIRLAVNELRRVTAGRKRLLVTIALVLAPLLFGCLYLVSEDNPDGQLQHLPAALVVQDAGANTGGHHVQVGDDVATALENQHQFDWTRTDAASAAAGLRSGKYSFSLTLPREFSAALTAPRQNPTQRGLLKLTTSNAQHYLARPITDAVSSSVRDAVAQSVGGQAANRLLIGFSGSGSQLANASGTAKQLAGAASAARDEAVGNSNAIGKLNTTEQQNAQLANQLAGGMTDLSNSLNSAGNQVNTLPQQAGKAASDIKQVAQRSGAAAQSGDKLAQTAGSLGNQLDQMSSRVSSELKGKVSAQELDKVRGIINDTKGSVSDTANTVRDTTGGLDSLAKQANTAADEANTVSTGLAQIVGPVTGGAKQAGRMNQIAGKERDGTKQSAAATSKLVGSSTKLRNDVGTVTGSASEIQQQLTTTPVGNENNAQPVAVQSTGAAKADTYTAGLAPFFLALALWVGAFALYLFLRPLSARALAAQAPVWRVAVGGWLPAALLAAVQALLLYVTVVLTLGLSPAHPVLGAVFLMFAGFSFTALLHGLSALLGVWGRVIWLALLVLQLFTTPGALPAQTLPGPLRALNAVLPMGYATNGVRQLCYGGSARTVATAVVVLAIWGLIGLALGMIASRRQRLWTAERIAPDLALT